MNESFYTDVWGEEVRCYVFQQQEMTQVKIDIANANFKSSLISPKYRVVMSFI